MASTLEGGNIDHIELDDILLVGDHFSMDALKAYSDMYYSFFSGEGAKYYIGAAQIDSIPKEDYEDKVFVDFVKFAMEYARQHTEKKYILDGIREILRRAEANTEFYEWNRLRIINECSSALLELQLT